MEVSHQIILLHSGISHTGKNIFVLNEAPGCLPDECLLAVITGVEASVGFPVI